MTTNIRIAVGSRNPVKIGATEFGFRQLFPQDSIQVDGFSIESGVSDQPMGSEETRRGAQNRANALKEQQPEFDFWCGIEGGIETLDEDWFASAWLVVIDRHETCGESKTALFPLPPEVKRLVESGLELGHANDRVFSEHNSKHAGGAIGSLTRGLITRQQLYEHAMTMALIPFAQPELFQVEA